MKQKSTSVKMMERENCGEKKGSAHNPQLICQRWRGSVTAWACTAAYGTGTLTFIEDFTADRSSRINAEVYRSILCAQIK